MILTADLLLESIQRSITYPTNQEQLEDDDLLAFADEEIVSTILPVITSLRQEYLVVNKTIDLVSGTSHYRIPQRGLGRTIRDVIFVDASGVRTSLPLIAREKAHTYQPTSSTTGTPQAFYLENDYIVIVPTPNNSAEDILVPYPLRPSKLVKLAEVGVVDSFNLVAGTVVITVALSSIATSTPVDIVSYTSGNIIKTMDITPTNVSSTTITFTAADLPSDLAAGDYICLAGESPVVPVPEEALVALSRAVQNRVLESIGDIEMWNMGKTILKDRLDDLRALLTPRVEGELPTCVGAANRHFLRGRSRPRRVIA